ncbi:alpha/beta fold hydrolase [Ferruginibacter sp. SUN106]|uniref:alpha/beta fold hydrolase n=1 Tax=Ferruginibacter sp. SUN106 TaxID=2978348 RepID=UPI003D361BC8
MTIYFLSGLGADKTAFKYLTFPKGVTAVFIDWLAPEKNETIQEYAKRIACKIDVSKPFILIGLSFGGMLATEVIEFVKPEKTILVSSAARRQELPVYYKLAGVLGLNKLLPKRSIHKSNIFTNWLFSISASNDKILLEEILTASNPDFSKWAINEIVNWKRTTAPPNIIRIHGDKDKVLPIINFKPQHLIKKGGHFMIANRANEISSILTAIINEK